MQKRIALSTAVLAATFSFAPIAGAQSAQQQAQEAQQRAQQEAQNAQNQAHQTQERARQAGSQVRGESDEAMQHNPDQMFVREAAADNQFEIQAAQFVQQQAQNEQVKQLAQQVVQDHQQAQQQLQQIAQQANMQVPSQLEEWQQAKLQHMQRHHGEALDRAFTFGQVGGHTTDILKYRYEAEHGQNPQIKQFAQQQIQTLEHHLQMARQTAEQWVPEARTAGEHIRGERSNSNEHGDRTPGGAPGSSTPENLNGTNAGNTGTGSNNSGRTNSGVNR